MLNRAALLAKINSLLPDNLTRLITAARLRTILADFTASFLNLTDDAAGFPVSSLTEKVTQTAHGFAKFSVLRDNGTAWVRTLAVQATDTDTSSEVFGVVSQVIDADSFVLTIGGKLDTTGLNLLPDTTYFASPTVPGAITAAPPTQENHVVKAVLITGKANTAYVVNYIGEVLGASGTTGPGSGNGGADLSNYYTIPQADTLLNAKVAKTDIAVYADVSAAAAGKVIDAKLLADTFGDFDEFFIEAENTVLGAIIQLLTAPLSPIFTLPQYTQTVSGGGTIENLASGSVLKFEISNFASLATLTKSDFPFHYTRTFSVAGNWTFQFAEHLVSGKVTSLSFLVRKTVAADCSFEIEVNAFSENTYINLTGAVRGVSKTLSGAANTMFLIEFTFIKNSQYGFPTAITNTLGTVRITALVN